VSRATIRTAVASFLAGANITGLQKVYSGLPMFFAGEQLQLSAAGGAGAFAYVELGESTEQRWSLPALYPGQSGSGDKGVHYEALILVVYQYLIPQQVSAPVSPDAWSTAEDAIVQGLKDRIHSDPQLGAPSVIFTAAQGPGGLRVSSDEPVFEPGKVLSTRAIEFRITEVIQA
jgi:hypothetical protein